MFRNETEAAMARAEAAERRLAELEALDQERSAELAALRTEVEALRAAAAGLPSKRQRRIWGSLVAGAFLLGSAHWVACILSAWRYADSGSRWYGFFETTFYQRLPFGLRVALIGLGLVLYFGLFAMAHLGCERLPESPGRPFGPALLTLALFLGPAFLFLAPWYMHRLSKHGEEGFHAAMTTLTLALHSLFFYACLVILVLPASDGP